MQNDAATPITERNAVATGELLDAVERRLEQRATELAVQGRSLRSLGDLDELAARPAEKGGPLALLLPRAPGAREPRWAHLLSGAVDVAAVASSAHLQSDSEAFVAGSELAALRARIDRAEGEASELRRLVERLYDELSLSRT